LIPYHFNLNKLYHKGFTMKTITKGFMLLSFLSVQTLEAEIMTDGSLGHAQQTLTGPTYTINEGLGVREGGNLFHSFSKFNINTGEQATFIANLPTDNILVRVTGGELSHIDGIISSESAANLWLMNPAGWVIGKNAQLNVQGSFHLSSADAIGFGDNALFYADTASHSVLSANAPIDYQFNQSTQAVITLDQADLIMPNQHDISIMGGDIKMSNASISAPGGRIVLASNSGEGQWRFNENGLTQIKGQQGLIHIEHEVQATIDSPSISSSDIGNGTQFSAGGIELTAENITLRNAYILSQAWTDKAASDTTLRAQTINLDASAINSGVQAEQNGGNIAIFADNLIMKQGSTISSDTAQFSTGMGGEIKVELSQQAHLFDQSSISSIVEGTDQGGNIQLDANSVILNDNSSLRLATQADGHAGNLTINSQQLTLSHGGTLDTSTVFGQGKGGHITVNSGDIKLQQDGLISSSSFAQGNAGNIEINTDHLSLINNSEINATSKATGATGGIQLSVNKLLNLQNNSKVSTLADVSDGGPIQINGGTLALHHSAIITSTNGEQANGGNINTTVKSLVMNGGFIQANAVTGRGGDIQVKADYTLASQGEVQIGQEDIRQAFSPDATLNIIQAAAPGGTSGDITINTVELNIAGELAKIESNVMVKKTIANDPCSIARNQKISSLIQLGRGGLPMKSSEGIMLPLNRHLLENNVNTQSTLKTEKEMLAVFSAHQRCTQDLN